MRPIEYFCVWIVQLFFRQRSLQHDTHLELSHRRSQSIQRPGRHERYENVILGWKIVFSMEETLVNVGNALIFVVSELTAWLSDEPYLLVETVRLDLNREHWLIVRCRIDGLLQRIVRHMDRVFAEPAVRLVKRHLLIPSPNSLVILVHLCDLYFDVVCVGRTLVSISWTAKVAHDPISY